LSSDPQEHKGEQEPKQHVFGPSYLLLALNKANASEPRTEKQCRLLEEMKRE